jgi:CRISPR/Cas system CSM-associated protein Csm3 (group 7 of RAMP superfamily)
MYRKTVGSLFRWRLSGTLETFTPMHIGDGGELPMKDRTNEANDLLDGFKEKGTSYASVFTANETPLIPGSSLKGSLRAWAAAHAVPEGEISSLFGELSTGSALTVHDAACENTAPWKPEDQFWSESRRTAVSSHVKINPETRTAQEHLLFYTEYVPAGTRFSLTFTAQNLGEKHRRLLLWILDSAFESGDRPARLGANISNGWGAVRWQATDVSVMETPEIRAWLNEQLKASGTAWTSSLRILSGDEKTEWLKPEPRPIPAPAELPTSIELKLSFQGAMLVNDPSRQRRGTGDGEGSIGHASIRRNGEYYLPASSVRGAFTSQLRRIWHTLAGASPDDAPPERLNASHNGMQTRLTPFRKLTGAGGWRSPLRFTDFKLDSAHKDHPQEFVAIDRFTGAVSGRKKFNAQALMRPHFSGRIEIDLKRLDDAKAGEWVWIMLLFVLRDWIEGDGSIGFGASKGYGAFRAEALVSGPQPAAFLNEVLARGEHALSDQRLKTWDSALAAALREVA